MAYDLRDFVEELKQAGELVEIDQEVDWNFEIPAFEVLSAREGGPALLFNKVKGIPEENGRMVVGLFTGTYRRPHKRMGMALGLSPDATRMDFLMQALPKWSNMLRPVEISSAACKEVVKTGKEVNLLEYPFTYHAIGDGGRYILLSSAVIKDPDSDWTNMGTYGVEIYSRNRLALTPQFQSNFVSILTTKYQARNESAPVAIVIGGDPATSLAAGVMVPPGVTEYDLAGGLRGNPIELVRCETSDILVPANAEMVIEGEIRPFETFAEGPRIECFGFSVGPRQQTYGMRVHCITHRKNPLLYDIHCASGTGSTCMHDAFFPMGGYGAVKAMGIPSLKMCAGPMAISSASHNIFSVIKNQYPEDYPGLMHDLYDIALGNPMLAIQPALLFMDDDVNPLSSRYGGAWEAKFTQVNPGKDIRITEKAISTSYMASSWMEKQDIEQNYRLGTLLGSRMIADATTKEQPPLGVRRTAFETIFPDETQQWVIDNWQKMGFEEEVTWHKAWIEAKL